MQKKVRHLTKKLTLVYLCARTRAPKPTSLFLLRRIHRGSVFRNESNKIKFRRLAQLPVSFHSHDMYPGYLIMYPCKSKIENHKCLFRLFQPFSLIQRIRLLDFSNLSCTLDILLNVPLISCSVTLISCFIPLISCPPSNIVDNYLTRNIRPLNFPRSLDVPVKAASKADNITSLL